MNILEQLDHIHIVEFSIYKFTIQLFILELMDDHTGINLNENSKICRVQLFLQWR